MQPAVWSPPVDLSAAEHAIVTRMKRAKRFIFLRQERHLVFDAAFQQELAALYADTPTGQPPIPPAQLASAIMLHADTGVSDDELIACTLMDRRWHLVLDCLDTNLDSGLVRAVGITSATVPEASVTESLSLDLHAQDVVLRDLPIDRAYMSSHWITERDPDLAMYCKAWPVRTGPLFKKTAFFLDWETHTIHCPDGAEQPCTPGALVVFPTDRCTTCAKRERCTTSKTGRSVRIHPDERLIQEVRKRQHTPAGRAKRRERVAVEHDLAHSGQWRGDRACYLGERKNLFDLRRVAMVHTLHVLMRQPTPEAMAV